MRAHRAPRGKRVKTHTPRRRGWPSASEAQGLSDTQRGSTPTPSGPLSLEAFKAFSTSSEMAKRKIYVRQHP